VSTNVCEYAGMFAPNTKPKLYFNLPLHHYFVKGNRAMLKTMIEILVENAIHSVGDNLGNAEIKVEVVARSEIVCATISDNGRLINPDALREPYRRLEVDRDEWGYGYALASVILKCLNGNLRLLQHEDGNSIEFWLPIAEVTRAKAKAT